MSSKTNRRAVLGGILVAGASVAVLPATAQTPTLSAIDRCVLDLWQQQQKLQANMEGEGVLDEDGYAALDEMGAEFCDIQGKIDEHLGASVLALAGVLMTAIYDESDEAVPGLNLAAFAAIRPQLVGAIAECADRVLAEDEEGA
jgi:hypothetical protein